MDEHTKWTLDMLNALLNEQKEIFQNYQGRVINPDNSEEYKEAKRVFDQADRLIKQLEHEIAFLVTAEPQKQDFLDEIWNKFKKFFKNNEQGSVGWSGVRG